MDLDPLAKVICYLKFLNMAIFKVSPNSLQVVFEADLNKLYDSSTSRNTSII